MERCAKKLCKKRKKGPDRADIIRDAMVDSSKLCYAVPVEGLRRSSASTISPKLKAEAQKARDVKQAESQAQVCVLQADSDAMQYTLPPAFF
jgi:hypothetical protein